MVKYRGLINRVPTTALCPYIPLLFVMFVGVLILLAVSQSLVVFPAALDIFFSELHQGIGSRLATLQEHAVAGFVVSEFFQWHFWLLGVKRQRIFAFVCQQRVVAIQLPVACLHCQPLLVQCSAHLDTVGDTVAVCNDQRRTIVCFSFY